MKKKLNIDMSGVLDKEEEETKLMIDSCNTQQTQLPTAQEFLNKQKKGPLVMSEEELCKILRKFAQLHCKAQREAIYGELQGNSDLNVGQLESILNAYPNNLIK